MRDYASKTTENDMVTCKSLWKTMKTFFTKKGNKENPNLAIQGKGNIV